MSEHDDFTDDLLQRIETLDKGLDDLEAIRDNLAELKRSTIRWAWQHNGWTLRQASAATGVPRSTLHRWHQEGDWREAICP